MKKEESRKNDSELKGLLLAVKLIWGSHKYLTLALATATLLQSTMPAAMAWLGKLIVDSVIQAIDTPNKDWHQLTFLISLSFVLAILTQVTLSLFQSCHDILGDFLTKDTNVLILEKAASLDLSYFETPSHYDMLQRANQEAGYRPMMMLQNAFALGGNIITLISLLLLLSRFNLFALIILFMTILPMGFLQTLLGKARFQTYFKQAGDQRKLSYLSSLLTSKAYVKEIKLFELHKIILERFKDLYTKVNKKKRALYTQRYTLEIIFNAIATFGYYGLYAWIIIKTVNSSITLGDMTMYAMVISAAQSKGMELLTGVAGLYEQGLFWENLSNYLQLPPRISSNEHNYKFPIRLRDGIELKGVSFKYPNTDQYVLHDINLRIVPGEKIAIVGPNGAGKTTLVKLLTRLYDPAEGAIYLDGIDLRDYDIEDLHSNMSVIFQDFVQYNFSARENIGFGKCDLLEDIDRIIESAQKSGAHEFISKLPQGYDTILGRWMEGSSTDLSFGEWQKIALARSYIRDAPLLILDEPTSSLDAFAEYEIYKNFREIAINRTLILISHRYSTVRLADRILVLMDGRIIENGCHKELIARNGLYATMYKLQAQGYQL